MTSSCREYSGWAKENQDFSDFPPIGAPAYDKLSVMMYLKETIQKLALISLAACVVVGCGGSGGSNNNGGNTVTVLATSQHTFNPSEAFVPAGQSVVFRNTDSGSHTVTSDSPLFGPNSDGQFPNGLGANDSYTFTVPAGTAAGTHYFYHCRFHGNAGNGTSIGTGMAGEITVQ